MALLTWLVVFAKLLSCVVGGGTVSFMSVFCGVVCLNASPSHPLTSGSGCPVLLQPLDSSHLGLLDDEGASSELLEVLEASDESCALVSTTAPGNKYLLGGT